MDSLRINPYWGQFAAFEKLSTHDPIFIPKENASGARPASSQKDQKRLFSVQKGVQTIINTHKTKYQCKTHASIEKGSKGRAQ